MQDNISRFLHGISDNLFRRSLDPLFRTIGRSVATVAARGAGLEIAAAASTLAQIGSTSTFVATVNGRLVTVAAGVDMPALTGLTIAASSFNVACFFISGASVVTVAFGTSATTVGGVRFPDFPVDLALVGFLLITHSATFTGGTTALDTATTVYVSPVGAFDPTFLYN